MKEKGKAKLKVEDPFLTFVSLWIDLVDSQGWIDVTSWSDTWTDERVRDSIGSSQGRSILAVEDVELILMSVSKEHVGDGVRCKSRDDLVE